MAFATATRIDPKLGKLEADDTLLLLALKLSTAEPSPELWFTTAIVLAVEEFVAAPLLFKDVAGIIDASGTGSVLDVVPRAPAKLLELVLDTEDVAAPMPPIPRIEESDMTICFLFNKIYSMWLQKYNVISKK
jgi:hypothetical protein